MNVLAMKLETGKHSTLAQDGQMDWLSELEVCRRYLRNFITQVDNTAIGMAVRRSGARYYWSLPVGVMRGMPTLTHNTSLSNPRLQLQIDSTNDVVTSLAIAGYIDNVVTFVLYGDNVRADLVGELRARIIGGVPFQMMLSREL